LCKVQNEVGEAEVHRIRLTPEVCLPAFVIY
jgi:hypothetical protein